MTARRYHRGENTIFYGNLNMVDNGDMRILIPYVT